MQVEASYPKYAGRVPPLDLSQVNAGQDQLQLQQLWASNAAVAMKRHHPYQMLDKCRGGAVALLSDDNNNNTGLATGPNSHTNLLHPMGSDGLPLDPRDWTRADVWKWLINMAVSEGLEVTPELPQKFPMNGKALCLMSLDMYLCRVPVGGKMLYRDFRVRLARAMALLS
ncbi:ETS homologous factor [Drosophila grimshawi]|uniref:GH21853 n=1 Tax=Drosophila grimshawi TaxID=7222 RepID=B4J7N5_DROGR|nr:ETS homologous factor [Drosophila grimshawi]EDW02183.1 GH21853 [Drosophila grimshawi]